MASIEDILVDKLVPKVREAMRAELRELMDELRPARSEDELLSLAEVRRIYRFAPGTVRGWVRSGKLRRYGTGRRQRFRREDLERFLAADSRVDARTPEEIAEEILNRKRSAR